ncbi:GntP family permease [Nocardiopsis coralliicola]
MDPLLLAALLLGVASAVALILWSRLDAFVGLFVGALVTGSIAGVPPVELIEMVTTGFGNTLAGVGIVIAMGVMIGKVLEESGAADALAKMFVRMAGKGREDVAMAATGSVVSVPVFCDSGFVILHPLARSLARRYGKPLVVLSLALAGGLSITHHLVPPTPGPLAAVGLLGADMGMAVMAGGIFALLLIPVVVVYARVVGPRLESQLDPVLVSAGTSGSAGGGADGDAGIPRTKDGRLITEEPADPGIHPVRAIIPLLLPLLLIVGQTVSNAAAPGTAVNDLFSFIGAPPIALAIGLVIAVYLLPKRGTKRSTVVSWLTAAASSAGMIVFVTGAGGAFGHVLNESGVGDALADAVAGWPLPLVLVPFLIATFVRLAQGSGTVAMITSATLSAPLVTAGGLDPTLAVLAACSGSFVFSYVSDSYFWVVTRFTGLSGVPAMKMWSGMSTTLWLASLPLLGIAALILQ